MDWIHASLVRLQTIAELATKKHLSPLLLLTLCARDQCPFVFFALAIDTMPALVCCLKLVGQGLRTTIFVLDPS